MEQPVPLKLSSLKMVTATLFTIITDQSFGHVRMIYTFFFLLFLHIYILLFNKLQSEVEIN